MTETETEQPAIVRIDELRRMSAHEIVAARKAGRLDVAAIAADRARRSARRTDTIRRLTANGATFAQAREAADALDAADTDDPPPAA